LVEPVRDLLKTLSVGDLRQLLAIKETQPEIEKLIQKRDDLLGAAENIQRQIDELILSRCRGESGRRISYGKRVGPTIKQMCEEIMLRGNGPLTAADVKNRILERWPEKNTPTLYNQVFIALGRSDLFKKVKKGKFALREGALKIFSERKEKENGQRKLGDETRPFTTNN
jgi:hypothetical protein